MVNRPSFVEKSNSQAARYGGRAWCEFNAQRIGNLLFKRRPGGRSDRFFRLSTNLSPQIVEDRGKPFRC